MQQSPASCGSQRNCWSALRPASRSLCSGGQRQGRVSWPHQRQRCPVEPRTRLQLNETSVRALRQRVVAFVRVARLRGGGVSARRAAAAPKPEGVWRLPGDRHRREGLSSRCPCNACRRTWRRARRAATQCSDASQLRAVCRWPQPPSSGSVGAAQPQHLSGARRAGLGRGLSEALRSTGGERPHTHRTVVVRRPAAAWRGLPASTSATKFTRSSQAARTPRPDMAVRPVALA